MLHVRPIGAHERAADILDLLPLLQRIDARVVVDGRGAALSPHLEVGYQKFLGLEIALGRPHGLTAPLVMDATVRRGTWPNRVQ